MGGHTHRYLGREDDLEPIFGGPVQVLDDAIVAGERRWPIVDDIIVTLRPDRLPPRMAARLGTSTSDATASFAPAIQRTFGDEWTHHGQVLAEHEAEFRRYFDLIDLDTVRGKRVADLGCGSGRWASFMAPACGTLAVVDFSDSIFVAQENLREHENVVFVLADVLDLPFAADSFDLAYCLGVLHHLPVDALDACRQLAPLAPELLVYLYYALDNRPVHFRIGLAAVSALRRRLCRITDRRVRDPLTWVLASTVYLPLARLGRTLPPRLATHIPLADTYASSSLERMRQDVEDRFFTGIEQRFRRAEIAALRDTFSELLISDGLPYWHFLCRR